MRIFRYETMLFEELAFTKRLSKNSNEYNIGNTLEITSTTP